MTGQPYQFLPPLSDAEYDALRADIAANGMRHPIIVDERGKILDGHHRAQVAAELGFKPEREVVAGLGEQEKRDLAFTLNAARRHMDQAQRRTAVIASLKADPQLSDRQHGRRTGVSHPTVASIRAELVAQGDVESLSTRTDSAGRQQPASRPQTPATSPEPGPASTSAGPGHDHAEGTQPVSTPVEASDQLVDAMAEAIDQAIERAAQQKADRDALCAPREVIDAANAATHFVPAMVRIQSGCEDLLHRVNGIDPVQAVADLPDDLRARLHVARDAHAYLSRVVDALNRIGVPA